MVLNLKILKEKSKYHFKLGREKQCLIVEIVESKYQIKPPIVQNAAHEPKISRAFRSRLERAGVSLGQITEMLFNFSKLGSFRSTGGVRSERLVM